MAVQPGRGAPQPWGPWQPAQQSVQSPQAVMRAAHADRERTVDVLKASYAEGRLTPDEYGQRVEAAYRALTYGELTALVADLPTGPMGVPGGMVPAAFGPPQPLVHPQPYVFVPPYRPAPPTNGMAAASMVLGLLGFMPFGIASLPAAVLGHVARSRIRESGEQGDGMATAGLVLGWIGTAFWALVLLFSTAA
ncbi:DUF1707 and DUF4190 domain-containing protein [Streptomyces sp. NPDC001380]|uniref:DUF1707 and DUF4190 domain-containing protein n=1 Tax=Streptomyces sp. NPDC001380 TaxID=3364566 RepID=UPI0036961937